MIIRRSALARIDDRSLQQEDVVGRNAAIKKLADGCTVLDLVVEQVVLKQSEEEEIYKFREEYIFPKLEQIYGCVEVSRARTMFYNPKNVERVINVMINGYDSTPMCDKWDASGIRYTTEILEI